MATNRPRYMISVDEQMFQEIEDFRFENRYQTRSEATSALIRIGLDALSAEKDSDTENADIRKQILSATRSTPNDSEAHA